MPEEIKLFVKGNETHTITTFRKFKGLILDMLRGYPEYKYYGKIESIFTRTREKVVEILDKDGLIKLAPQKEGEPRMYRLTPTGINLAISMINLDYSEKVLEYSKKIRKLTCAIIFLSILTLVLGLINLFI